MATITRRLAVGAVLAGAAILLAAPASADLTDGAYQANFDSGGGSQRWVVTSCGAGCKSVQWTGEQGGGGTFTYHLNGNTWTTGPMGEHTTVVMTIDNNTLAGTQEADLMGEPLIQRFNLVRAG